MTRAGERPGRGRAGRARLAAASALVAGAAGTLAACGPSLPSTPDSYVVPAVGDVPARTVGTDVEAYRRVFGDTASVYAVGPADASTGLPAAIVAVVALGGDTTEADVAARALGPGDQVVDRDVGGAKVRSAASRQGDISLQVRIWHPARDVVVVVIGTRASDEADAVMAAIIGQVSQAGEAAGDSGSHQGGRRG